MRWGGWAGGERGGCRGALSSPFLPWLSRTRRSRGRPLWAGIAWAGVLPGQSPICQSVRIEPRRLSVPERHPRHCVVHADSLALCPLPPVSDAGSACREQTCRGRSCEKDAARRYSTPETVGRSLSYPSAFRSKSGVLGTRKGRSLSRESPLRSTITTLSDRLPPARVDLAHFARQPRRAGAD